MDTLSDLLRDSARQWPGLPAVGLHDEQPWSWTYAELLDAAARVGAYLVDQGVQKGDRLVFWGGGRPECQWPERAH